MKGLDKIGIPYRFNDYRYIKKHPGEIACIIGKPHLIFERTWKNPIILGAGIYSHPIECPELFVKYPNVKRFLVPGDWMCKMCEPYYGNKVIAWPAGIDTESWSPLPIDNKEFDFLIYDKIRWEHESFKNELINPITRILGEQYMTYQFIRYGSYSPSELRDKLENSKAVIFLCEHETQGQAYQQILSTNVPILAWDRGGYWQDPAYFPDKVKYQPVSSVPYWDNRCGLKFAGIDEFSIKLPEFVEKLDQFEPRRYILEHLTLEKSAQMYYDIFQQVSKELA
ncbi:MAG TPA: hypothetical protein VGC08_00775 [Pedobacter sp.]